MADNLQINFYVNNNINPDLFSTDADAWAKKICDEGKNQRGKLEKNKASQIRKFYDEILKFYNDIKSGEDYKLLLPYIKMLNAKAAYAQGRNLVTASFTSLINESIKYLDPNKLETLGVLKNFFEAFMGYYKFYESKSKSSKED